MCLTCWKYARMRKNIWIDLEGSENKILLGKPGSVGDLRQRSITDNMPEVFVKLVWNSTSPWTFLLLNNLHKTTKTSLLHLFPKPKNPGQPITLSNIAKCFPSKDEFCIIFHRISLFMFRQWFPRTFFFKTDSEGCKTIYLGLEKFHHRHLSLFIYRI